MDDFGFGDPPRRAARLAEPRPRHARSRLDGRVWILVAALVVAGVVALVFLTGGGRARRGADDDVAGRSRARCRGPGTIGRAVVVAQTLHAERGGFPSDAATLSAVDRA